MEIEERAQLVAHYQNEIESIKSEVARLTNMFEQVLSSENGKGITAQPPIGALIAHIPTVSQNLGVDSVAEQHFVLAIPIWSAQSPTTMDLATDRPSKSRSSGIISQDKISSLEERLRAVEGNDWFDPIRAA